MLNIATSAVTRSHWLPEHVARIASGGPRSIPLIKATDVIEILPGLQLWDCWTIDAPDGSPLLFDGWRGWVIMCAPRNLHPDLRHDVARLRLAMERNGEWKDCGYLLPDHVNPGSREWAGSTVFDQESGRVTLFFTATGRRGESNRSFEQRLFQISGTLQYSEEMLSVTEWGAIFENVVADGIDYVVVDQQQGVPGFIKGFRDPFHFRNPADGYDYLLFTGSAKDAASDYNGVIGIARSNDRSFGSWVLLPPLLSAEGVNNELERPVLRYVDGLYYIFWSTQRKTFAQGGPSGPNGLYGMVSENLFGPYRPLNGSGLVAPNPNEEPYQCYSWWVDGNLEVTGFVDLWGLDGQDPSTDTALVERHFGGVPAPAFYLALESDRAEITVA